jgi:hypothetical protein
MWQYLTLYADRDDTNEVFYVKNYPEPKSKVLEDQFLNDMGDDGWELVAVVPSYGGGGFKINHQLYLKRKKSDWEEEPADSF